MPSHQSTGPREKQAWLQAWERFNDFTQPSDEDFTLVLRRLQLRLDLVGKNMDVLQSYGDPTHEPWALSNESLNAFSWSSDYCASSHQSNSKSP